jgi:spore germination protein GerM
MWKRTLVSLSFAALLAASTVAALAATPRAVAGAREVKVFLVALDDDGKSGRKIGCNDSLVSITREVSPTRAPLRAALEELLKLPQKAGPADSLHNALYYSKLKVRSVTLRRGVATVHLRGTVVVGGICDNPRVEGQIEATVLQFSGVRRVKVYVNNRPLSYYLSEARSGRAKTLGV